MSQHCNFNKKAQIVVLLVAWLLSLLFLEKLLPQGPLKGKSNPYFNTSDMDTLMVSIFQMRLFYTNK